MMIDVKEIEKICLNDGEVLIIKVDPKEVSDEKLERISEILKKAFLKYRNRIIISTLQNMEIVKIVKEESKK